MQFPTLTQLRQHPVVTLTGLTVGYGVIGTFTALQSFVVATQAGLQIPFSVILWDNYLAIAPWVPASILIAVETRRTVRRWPTMTAVILLGLFGLALVGSINLVQAGLLVSLGSFANEGWLQQFADGLVGAGHFGFLWFILVTLAASLLFRDEVVPVPIVPTDPSMHYSATIEAGTGQGRVILRTEEIDWIEARGDYVALHADGANHLKLERMKVLEAQLDPARFARVHRSAIVNLERVREYHPVKRGDYELVLASGEHLRLPRSRRRAVLDRLKPLLR